MSIKWDKKTAIRCITELRSPFEELGLTQNNQKPRIPELAQKIKELAEKNAGMRNKEVT